MVQGNVGQVSAASHGFNANADLFVTDEGVVVFDALGSPALGAALRVRIRVITGHRTRRHRFQLPGPLFGVWAVTQ